MDNYVLSHVSFNLLKKDDFVLRVPTHRLESEDSQVERICFAETIDGCINSMPDGPMALRGLLSMTPEWRVPIAFVYMVTVDEKNRESFISPPELKRLYGLNDAELHREHWAIKVPDNIVMSVIEIKSAVFYEAKTFGKKGRLMVKEIDYTVADYTKEQIDVLRKMYKQFRKKGIDVRRTGYLNNDTHLLCEEEQEELKRKREMIYNEVFKYDLSMFGKRESSEAGEDVQEQILTINQKIDSLLSIFQNVIQKAP